MEEVFLDVARRGCAPRSALAPLPQGERLGRRRAAQAALRRLPGERLGAAHAAAQALLLAPYTGIAASARRVRGVLRRHAYLILKSPLRIVSMMYYPTVTMIVWAFVTLYLAPTNSFLKDAPGYFIGAVLLWDVLFRGQLGVSLTFIEEFYARNLGNLFVSPLTLPEYIVGQLSISVLRALIGVGGACVFAYFCSGSRSFRSASRSSRSS
jgi:hypothetical protein